MISKRLHIPGIVLIFAGIVLLAAAIFMLTRPNQYAVTARIRMDPVNGDISSESLNTYDEDFIQIEFNIIQSEVVLGRVVEKLNLDSEWGKKYANGQRLKAGETIALLKRRMELRPLQNTTVVDLRVSSDDPVEAAKLANTIAEIYTQFRLEQRRELKRQGILTLKEELSRQEQTIKTAQDRLEQLKKESTIPALESEKNGTNHESYFSTENELENAMRSSEMIQKKLKEEDENRYYIINDPVVNIIDHAVPPTRPIGPNRPLAVAILSFGVLLIAGGFYLIRVSSRTRV